jgi:hypothetical protein
LAGQTLDNLSADKDPFPKDEIISKGKGKEKELFPKDEIISKGKGKEKELKVLGSHSKLPSVSFSKNADDDDDDDSDFMDENELRLTQEEWDQASDFDHNSNQKDDLYVPEESDDITDDLWYPFEKEVQVAAETPVLPAAAELTPTVQSIIDTEALIPENSVITDTSVITKIIPENVPETVLEANDNIPVITDEPKSSIPITDSNSPELTTQATGYKGLMVLATVIGLIITIFFGR